MKENKMKSIFFIVILLMLSICLVAQVKIESGVYQGRPTWRTRTPELHKWEVFQNGSINIYLNGVKQGDTLQYKIETVQGRLLLTLLMSDGYSIGHYWLTKTNQEIVVTPYHNPEYKLRLYRQ